MTSGALRIVRWSVAGTFVISALTKMVPIEVFDKTLVQSGLAMWSWVPYLSRLIVAVELTLGICLLQSHGLKKIILPSTALLLLIFSIYLIALAVQTGFFAGSCACFGEWIPMSPFSALVKNVVLVILLGVLYRHASPIEEERWTIPAGLAGVVFVAVFSILPPKPYPDALLPSDRGLSEDSLTSFRTFEGAPLVDLKDGRKILALFALDCEDCMEVAGKIGRLRENKTLPPVFVLFLGDTTDVPTFFTVAGTTFPFRILDPMTFFPLLGDVPSPPRVILLEKGLIIAEWSYATFDDERFEKTVMKNR